MNLSNLIISFALFTAIFDNSARCAPKVGLSDISDSDTNQAVSGAASNPFAGYEPTSTPPLKKPTVVGPSDPIKQADAETATAESMNGGLKGANEKLNVTRDLDAKSVKAINDALDRARKAQVKQINQLSSDPAQRSQVLNDQKILLEAQKSVRDDKKFSKKLAEQAQNPEVKKNLLLVSKGTNDHEDYKREESRLTANIAELSKLAAAAAAVAGSLGETKGPNGSRTSSANIQGRGKDTGISSAAESKATTTDEPTDATDAKLAAMTDKEKAAMLKELLAANPKSLRPKDLSLRNKLIAQLKAAETAEKKDAGDVASGINRNGKRENAATKAISDVLSPPTDAVQDYNAAGGGKGSGGFSLSSSETNAEVKRLTDEADRQLTSADDTRAGILEIESPSLFERVKVRITGCLRQRCVNSNSIAQI